jgi:hypothetical protein
VRLVILTGMAWRDVAFIGGDLYMGRNIVLIDCRQALMNRSLEDL